MSRQIGGRPSNPDRDSIRLWASMMCARLGELDLEVRRLEAAGIDGLHVDLMDGHFVPNLGLGMDSLRAIAEVTSLPIAVHAMLSNPEQFVGAAADAGATTYIVHAEAVKYPGRLGDEVRAAGMRYSMGINPSTAPSVFDWLPEVDEILVMTVEAGFAGGAWIPESVDRVRLIQAARPLVPIVVDGHIDYDTAGALRAVGATDFVCGTSVLFFPGSDYAARVQALGDHLARPASLGTPCKEQDA